MISGTTFEARWLARDAWWLAFVWGVAALVLGIVLLLNPSPSSEFFFVILSGMFLTAGVAELIHVVTHLPRLDGRNLIRGVLSLLVAALVLIHPLGVTARVTYYAMAIVGFGNGVSDLTELYLKHRAGVRMPLRMTLRSVVPAVVSIVFGVAIVFLVVDASTLSRTVLLTGVAAVLGGAFAIFLALRARHVPRGVRPHHAGMLDRS
jgi:uncharacterized membrane protein HdeD (DUF308 family)